MNEVKDGGKLAYNAYCEAVGWKSVRGDSLPKWEEQSERLQIAWDKAALAVAMAVVFEQHESR
jgi:hypothetical protein